MTKTRKQLAGAHLADAQVADAVRMLTRGDLDHEMVCIAARDRIMWLSERVQRYEQALGHISRGPNCWCDHSANNPYHSASCKELQELMSDRDVEKKIDPIF